MGISMNITRPQVYNINITTLSDGTVNVSQPELNLTTMNETTSYKAAWAAIWT
jgi:hypothetical protein